MMNDPAARAMHVALGGNPNSLISMEPNYIQLVASFHEAMNYATPPPTIPVFDVETVNLRLDLLEEELKELRIGLFNGDPVEVLDALGDIQYVLSGAILALGYSEAFSAAFRTIHENNMGKLWSGDQVSEYIEGGSSGDELTFIEAPGQVERFVARRADGKIMKPPGFTKVSLTDLVPSA